MMGRHKLILERFMDLFSKFDTDGGYFGPFRLRKDKYFTRPVLDPLPGPQMTFEGKPVIQWSVNNYMGLAENEEIKAAAVEAVKTYGTSAPMGSRMMTGNTERHQELERRLAEFLEKEAALVFNTGFLGVTGTIQSLVGADDYVLMDKMSHASMIDGTLLSRCQYRVFKHNDMDNLEYHLKKINENGRKGGVMIITEGVFGMEGDLGDLPAVCDLKDKYNARLFVDDAHGFGVMGEGGQGTAFHFGVQDRVDVLFGTFSKAFAAIGGVTASSRKLVDWIQFNARTQIFTKSLPMVYVEVIMKTLELIRDDREGRRRKMWENAARLKDGLRALGYNVGNSQAPITPVYVPAGDIPTGESIVRGLRDQGIFITGLIHPVVPRGILLFRMIPTASHTDEQIQVTLDAFKKVRDDLKLKLDPPAILRRKS
jgi:glycine C-acetyltransferase